MKVTVKIAFIACALVMAASLGVSCKKKKDSPSDTSTNTTPAPAPIDINHKPVVEYSVDGTSFTYPANDINGGMSTSSSLASEMSDDSRFSYGYFFANNTTTYFSVDKGTLRSPGIGRPEAEEFRAFFVTGSVGYHTSITGEINGIVIEHRDPSGSVWASNKGSANQSGSVFRIEAVKEGNDFGYQNMKVYATFNCKLYDGNGNSKTLTNGKFVGYFENN